jgi:hypothetical protein
MKKLLIILLLWISILSFNNKTYSFELYENKVCESIKLKKNEHKFCYKKHYVIEGYNDWFISKIYDNSWKLLLNVNNIFPDWLLGWWLYVYEWKYWNHIYIDNSLFLQKYDTFLWTPIEINYKKYDENLTEKDLWVYIDWKKVFDYALSTEKYRYKCLWDFANRNWIVAYDYNKEYIWEKDEDEIYLSERTRVKLDKFVQKVEKIKYPKEKLLKKLEVLYKKYEWKKWYKARFYKEVITYLYVEVLINKLKQSDKLEKINFYD